MLPAGSDDGTAARGAGDCADRALAAGRETIADDMADANGSIWPNGNHWDMPSHQQIVLGASRARPHGLEKLLGSERASGLVAFTANVPGRTLLTHDPPFPNPTAVVNNTAPHMWRLFSVAPLRASSALFVTHNSQVFRYAEHDTDQFKVDTYTERD